MFGHFYTSKRSYLSTNFRYRRRTGLLTQVIATPRCTIFCSQPAKHQTQLRIPRCITAIASRYIRTNGGLLWNTSWQHPTQCVSGNQGSIQAIHGLLSSWVELWSMFHHASASPSLADRANYQGRWIHAFPSVLLAFTRFIYFERFRRDYLLSSCGPFYLAEDLGLVLSGY